MLKTLDTRISSLAKSEVDIRLEPLEKNPKAKPKSISEGPCATCSAHNQAICSGLKDHEMAEFARNIRTRLVKTGQSVYREFEEAKYVYSVVSGEIRLANLLDDGRRQITSFKSAGEVIGEQKKGYYQSDAEAVCDTVVCQIPIKALDKYHKEMPSIQSALSEKVLDELHELRHHAILLGRKTPIEKIATFLVDRARKIGDDTGNKVEVKLTMGRNDIADFLGLTIETVSRTITKLRKMGVLDVPSNHLILIKDLEWLENLAEGEK
ncbi:helix-turn-helix domain-containing protein [Sneathiella sp. HT1-7]|jgi:CRP/FNR family transcriptional regulator|uniref:helix-turn-helix domain-containing protein n=1 Tax=Sneathiella sp. HT1-7 TaxID=2887192 RepID=UPI001D15E04B|nr:helix-turn-helix domain-containing protein [Sneathiella sp. HT1-7]MCC3306633.1 helix-turn-helix domain-containing protein [Sneathiella sp. HT1-7]